MVAGLESIRGHSGQNSTRTQCCGFISLNLDVVVFWLWNPDVMVYVLPQPRFYYYREIKKKKYVNYVDEKYFNCPNLCNIYLHNVSISKLE